jgi:hypothetical protein
MQRTAGENRFVLENLCSSSLGGIVFCCGVWGWSYGTGFGCALIRALVCLWNMWCLCLCVVMAQEKEGEGNRGQLKTER